ncbi:leucine-rich repeat extensin-like protein [Thalictrum thalictroides]|uniref:Leucine-rich repeat extensin-like protein n=1 Tax=Thalictrum thalictroides TaxID=46969 RepID=A0A7J6WI16_THATH|nr:leucine-rich repeat extensin-like protein [Thalictrum thalictroides]
MASIQNNGIPTSPSGGHTTVIVLFVSLGGIFFLACLFAAICFFIKKKRNKVVQKSEVINVDEHLKVHEAIAPGPHGTQAVVLTIEEDVHVQEQIKKNELSREGLEGKNNTKEELLAVADNAASSAPSAHHLLELKH